MSDADTGNSGKNVCDIETGPSQDGPKGRVLVIDDKPFALETLRRIFEKAGDKVSTFTSSISALKRLEEEAFDLIISDIRCLTWTGSS